MFEAHYNNRISKYDTLEDMMRDIVLNIGLDNVKCVFFMSEDNENLWQTVKVR